MKKAGLIALMILIMFIAHLVLVAQEGITFDADIRPVLDENGCSGCHGFVTTYEGLLGKISTESATEGIPIVNPSKPDSSVIIWRLEGKLPSGNSITRMPKGDSQLSEETINLFKTWIEQGANQDILVGIGKTHTWSEIKKKYNNKI